MKPLLSAFLVGLLFALGLGLSGMAQPAIVLAFLDVTGNWNPALPAVMIGAIGITLPAYRWLFKQPRPLLAPRFFLPKPTRPSLGLFAGALLFGIGWGLSGYCPGAGFVAASGGAIEPIVFSLAMLAGFYLYGRREAPALTETIQRDAP